MVILFTGKSFAQHHFSGHSHAHASFHPHHTYHYHSHSHSSGDRSDRTSRYHAQRISVPMTHESEFTVNTGMLSDHEILDSKVTSRQPIYSGSFKYYFNDWLGVSLSAGVQYLSGKDTGTFNTGVPGITAPGLYDFRANAITVAGGFTWVYFGQRNYQLYGSVEAGISIFNESDRYPDNTSSQATGIRFNGHCSLLGFRYGRSLGCFVELGLGYKGLINTGISYQAGWKKAHRFS
jgi:hypothetical protein